MYPVECLNFEIRAKGFAFNQIVQQISQLANSYVWPIALVILVGKLISSS